MVYYKLWTYHSENDVSGLRLTLDIQSGSLLLAGLVTLVTTAGAAFWSITAYAFLRTLLKENQTDALGASTRLTLANSRGAATDSWTFFRLGLRWHRHRRYALLRCLAMAILSLALWGGWTTASLFVSRATLPAWENDLTPIDPTACGLLKFDTTSMNGVFAESATVEEATAAAQIWVKECYSSSSPDPLRCSGLPTIALNYTGSNAPCPWTGNRCHEGPNTTWRMRTSLIDSNLHLGVNAKRPDRVGVIIDFTCSVIHYADVLTTEIDPTTNGNYSYLEFNFGAVPGISNFTWRYSDHTPNAVVGYQILPISLPAQNSRIQVIPAMNSSNADLVLAFFAANSMVYTAPNQDPLYSASGNHTVDGYIASDSYVKVVACQQQYQLHNPVNNLNSTVNSIFQLNWDELGFNEQQTATTVRILNSLIKSDIYNSIAGLGDKALLASSLADGFFSPGLPDNQWIAEAQYWFEVGLTKLARYMVDFPTNSKAIGNARITIQDPSLIPGLKEQCGSQLGSTLGSYQTFSFIAVLIILIISILIIVLSWTLGCCVGRSKGLSLQAENGYQMLALLAENLQERGHEDWLYTDSSMPVRSGNTRDIRNPTLRDGRLSFPRLSRAVEDMDSEEDDDGITTEVVEVELRRLSAK